MSVGIFVSVRNWTRPAALWVKGSASVPNETAPRSTLFWLEKAEEARTRSEGMHDAVAAATMLRVAEFYALMARHAAAREARTR